MIVFRISVVTSYGIVLCFLALNALAAHAADTVWIGADNDDWSNHANWDNGASQLDDIAIIPAGASVTADLILTVCAGLILEDGAQLIVEAEPPGSPQMPFAFYIITEHDRSLTTVLLPEDT